VNERLSVRTKRTNRKAAFEAALKTAPAGELVQGGQRFHKIKPPAMHEWMSWPA
jgi:hypothetical protein